MQGGTSIIRRLAAILVPVVIVAWVSTLPAIGHAPVSVGGRDASHTEIRLPPAEPNTVAFVTGHGPAGHPTATQVANPATAPAAATDEPATALRVALGQLLAEHAFLVLDAIRSTTLSGPDASAATEALDRNSSDLAAAFGSVYAGSARQRFDAMWRTHIELILDYARAKSSGDSGTMDRDKAALDAYRVEFVRFLASANPKIDASAEAEALRLHIEQLLAYTDADFDRAYGAQRAAFEHMFMFGDQLALAIARQFPTRFSGANVAFAPAAELRIALDRLLAEHLVLTAEATRALLDAAPDADAAARAIADNTTELRTAVSSVYDDAAGTAFETAWNQHIDRYLELIHDVATGDATARATTLARLVGAEGAIVDFFAQAVPGLGRDDLTGMVREHVAGLVAQLDAYARGDYPAAYAVVHDAYRHMFDIGRALSAGIAAQFPDRFASLTELPATDTTGGSR
ncbi:MAG TPA: hypothetical protein VFI28_07280 [Candidatus Limnocylindrales bacterium]|nr:hypothetical protein [Candidatus Limnocylindrales bacterium]